MISEDSKIKVAIITNIPTPYRKKQWDYYAKSGKFEIMIFYCKSTEEGRSWEYNPSKYLKEIFLKGISFKSFHFNPSILKTILGDYDVYFIGGYGYPTVILSIIALKLLKKPWVIMIDGISPSKIKRNNFILDNFRSFLIKGANAYFANGVVSFKLLEKYGISSTKIFNQFLTVDVDYLMQKSQKANESRREIRQKYGISENSVVVMYAGRLVKNKGVQDLIKSIKILRLRGHNIKGLIVGEGSYKKELELIVGENRENIIFTGHVDSEQLFNYYYASDIFVLPTYDDPWGLVVNEAMACGLPVVVSEYAGCYCDLVKDNGFVINRVNSLSSAIEKLVDPKERLEKGRKSIDIASRWTYKESFKSFFEVIDLSLSKK